MTVKCISWYLILKSYWFKSLVRTYEVSKSSFKDKITPSVWDAVMSSTSSDMESVSERPSNDETVSELHSAWSGCSKSQPTNVSGLGGISLAIP
jgi:hypothetical protein